MLNPKLQYQNLFVISVIRYLVLFVICVLCIVIFTNVYALNLDKVKVYFLSGDYKSTISEGEKMLASAANDTYNLDELYYILGLSYLKEANFLRASDIFEIILAEFKDSAFKEEARLGIADIYFLKGNYEQAQVIYKELIKTNPPAKLAPLVYYRISQCALKLGNTEEAKEYLDKLKRESPLNLEVKLNQDLKLDPGFFYTIQVGHFSSPTNAKNLMQKLVQKGYPAYMEEANSKGEASYRVRVGKFRLRQEAVTLENKLILEGYPTKIFP